MYVLRAMEDVDRQAVRDRLQGYRGRLALYQEEVAKELGVPRRTFQSWESGEVLSKRGLGLLASYYSEKLGEEITVEAILYGAEFVSREEFERMRSELQEKIDSLRADLFLAEETAHLQAA